MFPQPRLSQRIFGHSAGSAKLGQHHLREQKTVPLVNHAFVRVTPAIFVIFVVSRGSSSKALALLVRTQIRHFRHFRQKPPLSGGSKHTARFTKSTVFGTPTIANNSDNSPRVFLIVIDDEGFRIFSQKSFRNPCP